MTKTETIVALIERREKELAARVELETELLNQLSADPSLLDQSGPDSANERLQTNQAQIAALRAQLGELDRRLEASKAEDVVAARRAQAEADRERIESAALGFARLAAKEVAFGKKLDAAFASIRSWLEELDAIAMEKRNAARIVAGAAHRGHPNESSEQVQQRQHAGLWAAATLAECPAGNALAHAALIEAGLFDKGIRVDQVRRAVNFTIHPDSIEDAYTRAMHSAQDVMLRWLGVSLDGVSPKVVDALTVSEAKRLPKVQDEVTANALRHERARATGDWGGAAFAATTDGALARDKQVARDE